MQKKVFKEKEVEILLDGKLIATHSIENEGGEEDMGNEEKLSKEERLVNALLAFVERASKEGATAEEVSALPQVAEVLRDIVFL